MTKLQKRLDKLNTAFGLQETVCNIIANWVDHNTVNINIHPQKYHDVMITQENIGWSLIFAGHISQEWIKLYEEANCSNIQNNQQRHSYV